MVFVIHTPPFYLPKTSISSMFQKNLGHVNIQTTQNYYLELMPEKKHEQEENRS